MCCIAESLETGSGAVHELVVGMCWCSSLVKAGQGMELCGEWMVVKH